MYFLPTRLVLTSRTRNYLYVITFRLITASYPFDISLKSYTPSVGVSRALLEITPPREFQQLRMARRYDSLMLIYFSRVITGYREYFAVITAISM